MNNFKKQAIEAAYGKFWNEVKDFVDENGWIYFGNSKGFRLDRKMEQEVDSYNAKFRPKSLNGIETNNGWISILSESDLPKESGYYEIKKKSDGDELVTYYAKHKERFVDNDNCMFKLSELSHYKKFNQSNSPIF